MPFVDPWLDHEIFYFIQLCIPLKPIGPMGPRAGFIYSRLFKYTQQHTTGFTAMIVILYEAPYILMPILPSKIGQ